MNMRVGRSEAVDLLRKWRSESALLRCDLMFGMLAAVFRARVVFADSGMVKLLSDDTFSEMALPLSPDMEFAYGEPRDFPEDARIYESVLVLRLPGTDDRIAFTVITERS